MYWFCVVTFKGQTILCVAIDMNGKILLMTLLIEKLTFFWKTFLMRLYCPLENFAFLANPCN